MQVILLSVTCSVLVVCCCAIYRTAKMKIVKYEEALKKIGGVPAITKEDYDKYAMFPHRKNINSLITKINGMGNKARKTLKNQLNNEKRNC